MTAPSLSAQPCFVAKRLSAVEVRASSSNQHEFNADRLRAALGFSRERCSGHLTFFIYGEDGSDVVIDGSRYTIYDSREQHPTRSEFRLYYYSNRVQELSAEGDLLVLFREGYSTDLWGLIARAGSVAEQQLQAALAIGSLRLDRFTALAPPPASELTASLLLEAMAPLPRGHRTITIDADHEMVRRAVLAGQIPSTMEMSTGAQALVREMVGGWLDPDAFIHMALQAESSLYFAMESAIKERELGRLIASGQADLNTIITFAMGIQQSRKSRRGHSLQNHFAALLERERIPFSPQCPTEQGETPDFVFPGCKAYHSTLVQDSWLRMVACKSTVRDRWRQILNEAHRIAIKYLLTVDSQLTADTIESMFDADLRVFIPAPLLDEHYSSSPARERLFSVVALIDTLARLYRDSGGEAQYLLAL